MSKKQNAGRKGKAEIPLSQEESDELQMIVDRLAVQNPEGESFERYLRSLANALSPRPQLAAALVDKLSKNPNKTGFSTFEALTKLIEASPYKRHLKQAGYRFSQKGFETPDERPAPGKVVLIQGESRSALAHIFMVSGTLWLISALIPESNQTGHVLVTAFLEDDYATFNVRVVESTQKLYKAYQQKISTYALGNRGYEIPVAHCARLFFEMLGLWTGKDPYPELNRARALLERHYDPGTRPYAFELMPEMEHPEQHLSEVNPAELLEGLDLSWLRFSKNDLAPHKEKMRALDSPLLVIPREVQVERSLGLVRNAADELCAGETRTLYRRYFEELAMWFKLGGAAEKATRAWTVARHLAGEGPANANPAVFQVMVNSLRLYWPEDFEQSQAPPQVQDQERRTESGLILP
ncbi:MAG: hypothetical protein LLG06_05200 [Desulfobacteraceae bacterium]|nr:hypothetical protein [Desulfobacteraceae bacterium]